MKAKVTLTCEEISKAICNYVVEKGSFGYGKIYTKVTIFTNDKGSFLRAEVEHLDNPD